MSDYSSVIETFKQKGFDAKYFATGAEAAAHLCEELKGKTIGIGGSVTAQQLGLYEKLSRNNTVYCHIIKPGDEERRNASAAQVYISSVNGLSRTGEIVNIDGYGNRVAATLFGPEHVIFVTGVNKLADDFEGALWRARNIASPLNCKRLNKKTPCALSDEMRCYDCKSPERICRGFTVFTNNMNGIGRMELILIGEELGY